MKKLLLFLSLIAALIFNNIAFAVYANNYVFESYREFEQFVADNGYTLDSILEGDYFAVEKFPDDFVDIYSVDRLKKLFNKIILPLTVRENKRITECRNWLENIGARWQQNGELNELEKTFVHRMLIDYRIYRREALPKEISKKDFDELFKRVNIIPVSLVLAQAAKESGWGRSRFVLKANNIFGEWTFNKEAGLKPLGVDESARHRVRIFDSLQDSVRSYMNNLNSHRAYEKFRQIRAENGSELDSIKLVNGLENYSQRGMPYVREVAQLIIHNNLQDFDDF